MKRTIELSPATDRKLTARARRRGVPVEKYLSDIAEREAEAPEVLSTATDLKAKPNAAFLASVQKLRGQMAPASFDGINGAELVGAGRDERMTRIMGSDDE